MGDEGEKNKGNEGNCATPRKGGKEEKGMILSGKRTGLKAFGQKRPAASEKRITVF